MSCTNFNVTTFKVNIKNMPIDAKNDAKNNEPHIVNIYRFWAFDEKNAILPTESPFYLKMIQLINKNNPASPKNGPKVSANYLFHSQ